MANVSKRPRFPSTVNPVGCEVCLGPSHVALLLSPYSELHLATDTVRTSRPLSKTGLTTENPTLMNVSSNTSCHGRFNNVSVRVSGCPKCKHHHLEECCRRNEAEKKLHLLQASKNLGLRNHMQKWSANVDVLSVALPNPTDYRVPLYNILLKESPHSTGYHFYSLDPMVRVSSCPPSATNCWKITESRPKHAA